MSNHQSQNSGSKKRKQTWIVMISTVAVLLVIAGIVAIVFQNKDQSPSDGSAQPEKSDNAAQKNPSQEASSVLSYNGQPMMGDAHAPVKIAEFGDYKCIYCRQFEMEIFPKLKKDFIDTGKVQFYFMNYTIIAKDSVLAADAGEAIFAMYPDRFWDFHQLLYENQGPETEEWATNDFLLNIAKKAVPNLDENKFLSALQEGTYVNQIRTDANMGKAAGIEGTPTIFVNGNMLSSQDTFDYDSLKKAIQQAIDGEKTDNGK
ncbi:MAG: thioredoxin domain-containing protein [Tuberibacillus sp.]